MILKNKKWEKHLRTARIGLHKGYSTSTIIPAKVSEVAPTLKEGKRIQNYVLDSKFWHDINICIKAMYSLIKVLRLVNSDQKPAMNFIYKSMDEAKEKTQVNFGYVKKRYISC